MALPDSFFASPNLLERPVQLGDEKHTVHFRELPALAFKEWREQENSENANVRHLAMTNLLVAGVCNPDGSPALTLDQAKLLKPVPMTSLVEALLDANGVTSKAKKQQGND